MSEIVTPNVKKLKIAVAMSGGVDSSVAALLLKKAGHEVVGIFMKNWEESDVNGRCHSADDYDDVAKTCVQIGIPYFGFNFVKEYRDQVFAHFVKEYNEGFTPNPDILCNREIKFKVFYEKALELGMDYIATGHYCQNIDAKLVKARDENKDQSYFLYAIDGSTLKRVLFPLGGLKKPQVREIAKEHGLPTHAKKDSTGICFIGERKFRDFLKNYVSSSTGDFKTLDGKVVGKHHGSCFYTLGQRKGLGLGGEGKAWHVVKKDVKNNVVYVERDHDHPLLYASSLIANEETWISKKAPNFPLNCQAKIRYRQKDQECLVTRQSSGDLLVSFSSKQWAISPRQSVVFYLDNTCLGGAVIK